MTILRVVVSIAAIALLLTVSYAEDQPEATPNIATEATSTPAPSPTETATPTPAESASSTPTPTPTASETQPTATPEPAPAEQSIEAIQQRIRSIREAAATGNYDHKYLEDRIQEVIGSMTPQQKEAFEGKLSEEARAAYERYKKSREETERKNQDEQKKLEAEAEATLSSSDKIIAQEKKETYQKIKEAESSIKRGFDSFTFDLPSQGSQDLRFSLPVEQDVTLYARLFSNTDGVYGAVTEVGQEEPIWLYVYEDREKLVTQANFYSQKYLSFQGRANSSYLLRFVNHGTSRLVELRMARVLLHAHINNKLIVEDVADHSLRVSNVRQSMSIRLHQQRQSLVLQAQNQRKLMVGLDHYYFYNIGEIVLLGVICVIQVESIRKLLITSSVV